MKLDRVSILRLVDLCDELEITPIFNIEQYSMVIFEQPLYELEVAMVNHKYRVRCAWFDKCWVLSYVDFDYCESAANYIRQYEKEHK